MFTLALRNLTRQKGRTLIAVSAIVSGVAALILAGGFVEDIYHQLRDVTVKSRLGYLQVYRAGYEAFGRREPYAYMIEDPQALIDRARQHPAVTDVLQRITFTSLLNNSKTDRSVVVEGIEPAKESELGSFLDTLSGRELNEADGYAMVVGEGVAAALALEPGDYVTLVATTTSGFMNALEFEVVGVFRSFSRDFDARAVRIPLATAKALLDTTAVHSLVFSLADVQYVDPVVEWLEENHLGDDFEARTWLELDDFYSKTATLYASQFGVLQFIVLGIVLLGVANSVSMTAHERIGEFGTIRALGHTSGYVYRLLVLENAILGLGGATLGVLVGMGMAELISSVGIPMPPPPGSNATYTAYIRIVPHVCAAAFAIGLSATVASAVLTCRGPARTPLAEALRRNI